MYGNSEVTNEAIPGGLYMNAVHLSLLSGCFLLMALIQSPREQGEMNSNKKQIFCSGEVMGGRRRRRRRRALEMILPSQIGLIRSSVLTSRLLTLVLPCC